MKIDERKLSKEESVIIAKEIGNTKNITGYTARELRKLGRMIIATDTGKLVGIIMFRDYRRFIDFKLFLVLEEFRGRGIGRKLFEYFYHKVAKSKKLIYFATKNQKVETLVSRVGFKKMNFFALPIFVQLHQAKMVFSIFRMKEFFRKGMLFDKSKFSYWIRN